MFFNWERKVRFMRVTEKFGFLVLLFVAILFTQNASATLLPTSTYAQQEGNWQGIENIDDGDVHGFLSYAVYDRNNMPSTEEISLDADLNQMDGQYIYAYQVYNDADTGIANIASLQMLNLDQSPLDNSVINDIGSLEDDPFSGTEPSDAFKPGIWEFAGNSAILPGENSWFLVFTSDFAPVAGSFVVTHAPEPVTIALLGIGGLMILRRKKKVRLMR